MDGFESAHPKQQKIQSKTKCFEASEPTNHVNTLENKLFGLATVPNIAITLEKQMFL